MTEKSGDGLQPDEAIRRTAEQLNISIASVYINLPYRTVMYGLEEKSTNAMRIIRSRERRKESKKLEKSCQEMYNKKLGHPHFAE